MERRRVVGEKLIDLGNITAGALIFGQAISAEQLSGVWLMVGLLVMAVLGRSADHSTGGEMTFVVFLVGVLVVALSVAAFAWLSARPRAKRL
jgi:uncharacterized protein (DUF697 family)